MNAQQRAAFVDWLITKLREVAYINPELAGFADEIESSPKLRALLEDEAPAIREFVQRAPPGAEFDWRKTWTH